MTSVDDNYFARIEKCYIIGTAVTFNLMIKHEVQRIVAAEFDSSI